MRVISQNSLDYCYDFPYENTMFYSRNDNGLIHALFNGIVYVVSNYSTPKKAKKAMELLHEAYTGKTLYYMKNEVSPAGRAAAGEISWAQAMEEMNCNRIVWLQPETNIETFNNGNIVFQFPEDDELDWKT